MDFDYAEGWRPNPGDVIVGVVTDISMGHNEWGSYPIVTVKPDDGEAVAIHAFHTSLMNQFTELQPRQGETIGVAFKGKQRTKDGKREVAVYRVKVKGRTADVWGALSNQRPPQPPIPTDIPATVEDFAPSGAPAPDDDIPF